MNGGIDRDEVEMMWTADRINWRAYERNPEGYADTVERLGWCNADRLQPNENGIEALCNYVTKNPNGKKRWSSSRNLISRWSSPRQITSTPGGRWNAWQSPRTRGRTSSSGLSRGTQYGRSARILRTDGVAHLLEDVEKSCEKCG